MPNDHSSMVVLVTVNGEGAPLLEALDLNGLCTPILGRNSSGS